MTRKDSVHAAAESARESMRHAAEVVAPYAGTAKDAAVHYAHEANELLAPKISYAAGEAARHARTTYDSHLHPHIKAARSHVPPNVDRAATKAVKQTRRAARQAAEYTQPRLESALAAAQPVAEEAASRSTAAFAALRGQVSAEEVRKLVRRQKRRARTGRVFKGVLLVGVVAGGAYAAWKWWDRQSNPDWLVEPPAATELSSRDSAPASFDDELAAKEQEARSAGDDQQ
ncbi:DUF5324 family protein [Streptomyces sp. NPDC060334]|uniref:DUF5324 family protein n=1 Tax=unclassified Streptomyces TaxID=2593676 RepID=UPI0006AF8AF9|nr:MULTISPECIES: DUF5324 family protein [unclassified Streptomyces]MCX5074493.1 DUF5324 family protein [Streptomyces sp. NBC_00424]MCX5153978.1 DUF5324 family protein [Streptomyces sp. NBC_00291]WUD42325.1 DUF5324 family protein [Streptomyces sp. NBC_00513]